MRLQHVRRSMARILLSGWIVVLWLFPPLAEATVLLPFKGDVDFKQKKIFVTVSPAAQNPLNLQIMQTAENQYKISAYLDHWRIAFFDVTTTLESTVQVRKDKNSLQGELLGKDVLINNESAPNLLGRFDIQKDKLQIRSLTLGSIGCEGVIQILHPQQMNLFLKIAGMELRDFIFFISGERLESTVEGFVDGRVKIAGPLNRSLLRGKLLSTGGVIEDFPYQKILLNLQGSYPFIYLSDSNVIHGDGLRFDIAGQIDLSDTENFRKQIAALTKEPVIDREGSAMEWTLKSLPNQDNSGATEVKYRLEKDDFDHTSEKGSAMLGVQRKLEF